MAHIGILGLGNWGTAIAAMWLKDGHNVKGWTIEKEVYQSIMMKDENSVYLEGVSVKGLDVTMHLEEALQGVEIIVLAVPSSVILDVVNNLIPHLRPGHVLLDLAKGLAPKKRLISSAIEEILKENDLHNPLAVLTGPTIAPEAANGVMTTALVASEEGSVAKRLAETLSTPTFVLKAANDPQGAELWGAFKNVVALACGLVVVLPKLELLEEIISKLQLLEKHMSTRICILAWLKLQGMRALMKLQIGLKLWLKRKNLMLVSFREL